MVRAELRTKERLWICERPDSPDSSGYAPSSNESGEDDFDYVAVIHRANQRNQLPQTGSSTTSQSWAGGSWQGHRHHFVDVMHTTCWTHQSSTIGGGYFNTTGHLQETDGHN